MGDISKGTIAAACSYCGRENPDRHHTCRECGTALATPEQQPANTGPCGKSKVVAVCLSLIFGPLGLVYVNAWGAAFLAIAIGFPFVVTHKGGLWLTFGGRILCAVWAYCVLQEDDKAPNLRRDSLRLLNEAARLENVDRNQAIAAYEQIAKDYSGTDAGKEAARSIEVLRRHS
ncbi:MAG TPA: hypothetical protein VFZ59_14355 [Verrucomicrobiae bacterium]|nr:hypothetical protein [Verrucomicrobiae bacterium]